MKNSNKLSNDVKDISDNSPETNDGLYSADELFLYYSDICDSLQRAYAVISFYREHYKKQIPTPEDVE